MLPLKDLFFRLKGVFDIEKPLVKLDDQMSCYTFPFRSDSYGVCDGVAPFILPEEKALVTGQSVENNRFRYAVFVPSDPVKVVKGAIVLLHGLNERNWEKYLPWAYELSEHTGKPVILFPIAHHMNRAPVDWSVPRPMHELSVMRQRHLGKIKNSSFVNAAISCRLDYLPQLFVNSGFQSLIDLMTLTSQIKDGQHPLFRKGTHVDFFAYSIGAFITEILLMANPLGLYSNSKAFFFCGGSTFDMIDGRSKSILDDRAFSSLRRFILGTPGGSLPVFNTMDVFKPAMASIWNAFLSMVTIDRYRNPREKALKSLAGKIAAIGLKIDRVIPGAAILKTLGGTIKGQKNIRVEHFNFPYTHETPFPILNNNILKDVEKAFFLTFQKAGAFLC